MDTHSQRKREQEREREKVHEVGVVRETGRIWKALGEGEID